MHHCASLFGRCFWIQCCAGVSVSLTPRRCSKMPKWWWNSSMARQQRRNFHDIGHQLHFFFKNPWKSSEHPPNTTFIFGRLGRLIIRVFGDHAIFIKECRSQLESLRRLSWHGLDSVLASQDCRSWRSNLLAELETTSGAGLWHVQKKKLTCVSVQLVITSKSSSSLPMCPRTKPLILALVLS